MTVTQPAQPRFGRMDLVKFVVVSDEVVPA